MYIRKQHQWTDREEVFALIEAHALGAWVCHGEDGLIANHMPFVLDRSRGEHGTLMCHVARANPVWRALGAGVPSVVMTVNSRRVVGGSMKRQSWCVSPLSA